MTNNEQLQHYIKRLRQDQKFLEILLCNVVIGLNKQRLIKNSRKKNHTLDLKYLYYETEQLGLFEEEILNKLKNIFSHILEEESFWRQTAQWILSRLETFTIENEFPVECLVPGVLSYYPTQDITNNLNSKAAKELAWEESMVFSACAFYLANDLLKQLDLNNYSLTEIEVMLGLRKPYTKETVTITEPSLSNVSTVPTSAPFRAGVYSVYQPEGWSSNNKNWAEFILPCKQNNKNKVYVYLSESNGVEFLPLETALLVIDGLGLDAAKLQLVFGAYLARKDKPWKDEVTIKGTTLIKDIGWDKRKDLNITQKLNQLASIAHILGRLVIRTNWIVDEGQNQLNLSSTLISPLWFISVEAIGKTNTSSLDIEEPKEIYIRIRAGDWASKWFNRSGSKAKKALIEFGYLAKEILRINPYHDELALRLAIQLTMFSRIRVGNKNPYRYQVITLLRAIEIPAKLNKVYSDEGEAYKFKKLWDKAILLLKELGWQIDFEEDYPEWLRPQSKINNQNEIDKPKGWQTINGQRVKLIDLLTEAHIIIKPPILIEQKLSSLSQRKQSQPKLKGSVKSQLSGEQVKKARQDKGWTQSDLSGKLGISQSMVTKIERDERPINSSLEMKIREVLDIKT